MAFTEQERQAIMERLVSAGREYFARYGLRKTSVDDLARAAGIAKGSFYAFFDSKELLLMDIIEQDEAAMKRGFAFDQMKPVTPQVLYDYMHQGWEYFRNNSVMRRLLELGEFELLYRKIPVERVEKHIREDLESVFFLDNALSVSGYKRIASPEVVSALMRGIFFLFLHQRDIGTDVFEEMMDLLIRIITEALCKREREE